MTPSEEPVLCLEISIVRQNLMTQRGYAPYCGNVNCSGMMPRTRFDGSQFNCPCRYESALIGCINRDIIVRFHSEAEFVKGRQKRSELIRAR